MIANRFVKSRAAFIQGQLPPQAGAFAIPKERQQSLEHTLDMPRLQRGDDGIVKLGFHCGQHLMHHLRLTVGEQVVQRATP